MATPQHHRDLIEKMVLLVWALPSVEQCWINDFGRYSNFDVRVYKKSVVVDGKLTNGSYRPAIALMKRFCKEHKMIYRGHFIPHPKDYHQCMSVDIDFIPYDTASNTFEGVKPEGDLEGMNRSLFGW